MGGSDSRADPPPTEKVRLAPLTTLELGGEARFALAPENEGQVVEARRWARARGVPTFVMGGGSNVVVADAGFEGLVIRTCRLRGVTFEDRGPETWVTAAAGEPWDDLVTTCVERDLAGLECLAGIPGQVGATPIQNVGAYGQEVADTLREIRALDGDRGDAVVSLDAEGCGFGYRDSRFRRQPGRFVVLSVTFALRPSGAPTVRYAELSSALAGGAAAAGTSPVSLAAVSAAVRGLRRAKSMLLDPSDPNRRSAGSFFMNPRVSCATAVDVAARARRLGELAPDAEPPQFAAGEGRVKLAAGWLVEHAGYPKGTRRGAVGLSTRHALALVHHGGGTAAELVAFAREIRDAVRSRFDVTLVPEPIFLGLDW